jgi:N-methylhydantoinase B
MTDFAAIAADLAAGTGGAGAVFDAGGALLAQAAPRFAWLGATAPAVRRVADGTTPLGPHDVLLTNDPFSGGANRLPELVIVAPVLAGGTRRGFVAALAPATDIGGVHAGGTSPDAHEIFSEGLRIPPVRLIRDGAESAAVVRMIERNVRDPETVVRALRAQAGVVAAARDRVADVAADAGHDARAAELLDEAEAAARERLSALAGARGRGTAAGGPELRIDVGVEIRDGELVVDCTELPPQVGGPTNATATGTRAAATSVLQALVGRVAANDGLARALRVESTPGTVGDARFPAAVSGCDVVLDGIRSALLGALRDADVIEAA